MRVVVNEEFLPVLRGIPGLGELGPANLLVTDLQLLP